MKILIVDDSLVFRTTIKDALSGLEKVSLIDVAHNGKVALEKIIKGDYDIITLDMEMPEMSGLETIKEIKKLNKKARIIIFSAHTVQGSSLTLEALKAGADDFVPKPKSQAGAGITDAIESVREQLVPKINLFFESKIKFTKLQSDDLVIPRQIDTFLPQIIIVGSSTGGPPVLETVLKDLGPNINVPIVVVQHMPPIFTSSLARNIEKISHVSCDEAKDGEPLLKNKIYVAPGNYHLFFEVKSDKSIIIRLDQSAPRNSVRPAVDVTFESAVNIYGSKTLGIVLTGMGEDGLSGAKKIKSKGGGILIQNQESCVVFGMPGAIYSNKLHDDIKTPEKINAEIKRMCNLGAI